jgi:hypothetical protein
MKINSDTIKSLLKNLTINHDCHIIGIRGCSCSEYGKWSKDIEIEPKAIDHINMNCLFIVHHDGLLLPLQGSTTPHQKYLTSALKNGGNGANQLEPGFYRFYAKGIHNASSDSGHAALRQTRNQPVRRTADNLTFDLSDRIEVRNVADNIHAAWCNVNGKTHASAGCQVIAGYPDCKKREGNTSHWKLFHDYIYSQEQETFNYLLTEYRWVERSVNKTMKPIIIFGSTGFAVKALQKVISVEVDGTYGRDSYLKILELQKKMKLDVDGIVGEMTKKRLSL